MTKEISYHDSSFKLTKELLLSSKTKVIESVIGHKTLSRDFDNGMRSLDDHLVYYLTHGRISAWITGHKTCLKTGMIIWLSPNTHHHFWFEPKDAERANLYHFRFRLSNQEISGKETGFLLRERMQDTEKLISMYYEEAQSAKRDKNQRLRNILYLLFSDCKNHGQESLKPETRLNNAVYKTILDYTKSHIKDWPSPADLASSIGYSSDYFTRVFRKSFDITPQRWLVQQRIRAIAEEMENSPRSISEVAFDYGYKDIYFFSRQFKQVIGISPRRWRK